MATKKKSARKSKPRRRNRREGMHRTTIELPKEQWSYLERRARALSKEMGNEYTPIQALRALLQQHIREEKGAA